MQVHRMSWERNQNQKDEGNQKIVLISFCLNRGWEAPLGKCRLSRRFLRTIILQNQKNQCLHVYNIVLKELKNQITIFITAGYFLSSLFHETHHSFEVLPAVLIRRGIQGHEPVGVPKPQENTRVCESPFM
jgi:hypothetical protein